MKLFKIIFLFFFLIISCNLSKEKQLKNKITDKIFTEQTVGKDTIYNLIIAENIWRKNDTLKAVIIDTACLMQRKRAIKDIENGQLCYYNSFIHYEAPQMIELLNKYHIEFQDFFAGCFGPPPGFSQYCYEEEMHKEIYNKYGENFIDSLWLIAEKQFVIKYPDSIYIKDGLDIREKYLIK